MEPHPLQKYHTVGKEIAWSIITVGFSIFFFAVLTQAFNTPVLDARSSTVTFISRILLPIIMFSAFLGAFAIHAMIVERKLYRYLIPFFSSVTLFLFFQSTEWSFLAAIIAFGTLIAYHATVQGDMLSRVVVRPIYTVAAGLGTVVLALIASASLLYYSSFVSRPYALEDLRTSIRDSIVDTSLSFVQSHTDGFSSELTLDQVIANFLAGRIEANIIPQLELKLDEDSVDDPSIQQLKETLALQAGEDTAQQLDNEQEAAKQDIVAVVTEQLGEAEQQAIAQVRDELIQSLGIEVTGDASIREVLQKFVDRRIISVVDPYLKYAPIIFAASLFFILYIFSFLYRYLTRGFGLLWYGILRVSHFIFIKEIDIKAKRISLEK